MQNRQQIIHTLILLAGLLLMSQRLHAQTIPDLYFSSVPTASQTNTQQQQAIRQAFEKVLVKVSGDEDIIQDTAIEQSLPRASNLVETFSYRQQVIEGSDPQLWLDVTFSASGINRLLKGSRYAVWDKNRPLSMLWIAEESQGQKQIVSAESDPELNDLIEQVSAKRGLPVILPLLDLQDLTLVSVEDVWAPIAWSVQQASMRYASDAQLIGKISKAVDEDDASKVWQGQWLFSHNGVKLNWQTEGENKQQVVEKIIGQVADTLASQHASLDKKRRSKKLILTVYGVGNIPDYSKVGAYLRHLSMVKKLNVQTIGSDHVVFDLAIVGAEQQFAQSLLRDHVLSLESQDLQSNNDWTYRLQS